MNDFHHLNHQIMLQGAARGPHSAMVCGLEFHLEAHVFSPLDFEDPEFFAREIKVEPGQSFLEVGCGHGAISVIKALQGANPVVATDLNPAAVLSTVRNAVRHGVGDVVRVTTGDVYSPLKPGERYDVIFGNLPYNIVPDHAGLGMYERAFYNDGTTLQHFIGQSPDHLTSGGRLLIAWSPELADPSTLNELCWQAGYESRVIATMQAVSQPIHFWLVEARAE